MAIFRIKVTVKVTMSLNLVSLVDGSKILSKVIFFSLTESQTDKPKLGCHRFYCRGSKVTSARQFDVYITGRNHIKLP